MALRRMRLDDGNEMVLCPEHRRIVKDHIVSDEGLEQGGKWKCRVCTITRRLAHEPADAVTKRIGTHIVIRYPAGNFYCDCMAWRFQKRPAPERTCSHTELFERYPND